MTTWTDGYERLMRAAEKNAAKHPVTSNSRTIPLHVFLMEAQAATNSTDALCEYVVSRLVALHGPCGTIHGNQHALQSYLKKDDDVLNYENLRTVRGWIGFKGKWRDRQERRVA